MLRIYDKTPVFLGLLLALSIPACVIHDNGGGDEGASDETSDGDDGATSGSPGTAGSDADSAGSADSHNDSNADDSSGGADPDSGNDSSDGPGGQPMSGLWRYDGDIEEDTCNLGTTGYDLGSYQLVNNGDGTFTVLAEGEDPFDCELEGDGSFHCPARGGDAPDTMGADAHVEVSITVDGAFSSATAGSGVQVGVLTCAGSDCALAETYLGIEFPCQAVEAFTTEHAQ